MAHLVPHSANCGKPPATFEVFRCHNEVLGATMLKMWQFFLSLIVAHLLDCVQLWQLQEFVPRRFRFHNFENVAIRFLPIVANVLDCV